MSETNRSHAPRAFNGTARTVARRRAMLRRASESLASLFSIENAWDRLTLLYIQQRSTDEESQHPAESRRPLLESAVLVMIIGNIRHKRVRQLYHQDDRRGFMPHVAEKIVKMMGYLQDMDGVDELQHPPSWRAHQLTGNRKGTWSLQVTGNWRLTFDVVDDEIVNVDLEDYH